jgi:NAD(P)-dependent dehydrogenase (short-subunit alcohol dehydrogenase family)
MAGRSEVKGRDAAQGIIRAHRRACVLLEKVDLGEMNSIASLASWLLASDRAIDRLINNAGVMAPPAEWGP